MEQKKILSSGIPETLKTHVTGLVKGGDADKINPAGGAGVGQGVVQRQEGLYKDSPILYQRLRF